MCESETCWTKISGVFGEFSSSGSRQVLFIQTALNMDQIGNIDLVSDIKGSEKWRIRDLFQRDVDEDRVTNSLIPYFESETSLIFFSPLTLTLLPLEESTVIDRTPRLIPLPDNEENEILEYPGFFRVRKNKGDSYPISAQIEWNPEKAKVVAIDGQHRLTGLKKLADQNHELHWNIPVTVFILSDKEEKPLLPNIRTVFVNINTRAVTPTRTRQILLEEERINEVCVQEIFEKFHTLELEENKSLPLCLTDWRGNTKDGEEVAAPATLFSVIEVAAWIDSYVFPSIRDSKKYISALKRVLGIKDDAFYSFVKDKYCNGIVMPHHLMELVRGGWADVRDALVYFINNFVPWKNYADRSREILQYYYEDKGTAGKYAVEKFRYGRVLDAAFVGESKLPQYQNLKDDLQNERDKIPSMLILQEDTGRIGIRSLFYVFFEVAKIVEAGNKVEWDQFGKHFTKLINRIYRQGLVNEEQDYVGWFEDNPKVEGYINYLLPRRYLTFDQDFNAVNFRENQIKKGFGALLLYLFLCEDEKEEKPLLSQADIKKNKKKCAERMVKTAMNYLVYVETSNNRLHYGALSEAKKEKEAKEKVKPFLDKYVDDVKQKLPDFPYCN